MTRFSNVMMGAVAVVAMVAAAGGGEALPFGKADAPVRASAEQMMYLAIQPNDIVLGSPTAPVTLVEYSSMTCPHCADFAAETMPMVKKEWINTGKAKFVYRDLAWDDLALGMAKVVRCAAPAQRLVLAEALFASQKDIVLTPNPLDGVKKVAMLAGLDGAKVNACVKDAPLHAVVLQEKDIAMQKLGVKGTPALFVNGMRLEGAVPYKELKKTLETEYAKATAAKK